MAYVHFSSKAPGSAFLVVQDDGDPEDASQTVLFQTDWDTFGVACSTGFEGDEKEEGAYERAFDWLQDHASQSFKDLDEYLPQLQLREDIQAHVPKPVEEKPKPLLVHFVWTTKAGKRQRQSVPFNEAEKFMLSLFKRRCVATAWLDGGDGSLIGRIEGQTRPGYTKTHWHYWWNTSQTT